LNTVSEFPEVVKPTAELLPELRRLWQSTFFDGDAFLDAFFSTAYSSERARCLLWNGEIAGMLYWLDCYLGGARIAYIYAVATKEEYRGRGVCRRLMEDTHRRLAELGYSGSILSPATDELFGLYRKMGYTHITSMGELECRAGEAAACISSVSAEEYGRLRRVFLPVGGIVQEDVSLNFLATQAELYSGDGFLLAARRLGGGQLLGVELLGDISCAPSVLRALGCEKGSFRSPSAPSQRPFAAYRPIIEKTAVPTYLGHAFD